MSYAWPIARATIGVAGVAMMADAVYNYVYEQVNEYSTQQFALGASMVLGAIALPCQKPVPTVVTPILGPPSANIWYRAGGANTPVSVQASLTELPLLNRYQGGGILHRAAATIQVYRAGSVAPLVFDQNDDLLLTNGELRAGIALAVGGNAAGDVVLTLTLDPTPQPDTTVTGPVQQSVVVRAVNIITPTITAELLVLVEAGGAANPTTMSTVTLGYAQTDSAYPCGDLRTALTFGNQVTCWYVNNPVNAYASGTASANLALALLMRGVAPGPCNLSVQLTSLSGATDPSWHIGPAATEVLHVEQLAFDPFLYSEGGATAVLGHPVTRVAANPKLRELHQQNPANAFTLAKVPIRAPNAAFWTHASHLTLAAGAGVQLFSDQAGTVGVASLQQGDFHGVAEVDLWAKPAAVPALDPPPVIGNVNAIPLRNPEKVVAQCRISCGATIGGRQLVDGDYVLLDTFGFDRQLDRKAGNATSALLPTLGAQDRTQRAALSIAGGHQYYDRFSAEFSNHQHWAPHGGLYAAFLGSITIVGTRAVRAAAGAAFVTNFLSNTHHIVLAQAMIERLDAYILQVLNRGAAGPNYGFSQANGTPGTHAEVLAVNALVLAGLPLAETTVATYKLFNAGGQGGRFPACLNCAGILAAPVRVITG
jgi:hypothetical protein